RTAWASHHPSTAAIAHTIDEVDSAAGAISRRNGARSRAAAFRTAPAQTDTAASHAAVESDWRIHDGRAWRIERRSRRPKLSLSGTPSKNREEQRRDAEQAAF